VAGARAARVPRSAGVAWEAMQIRAARIEDGEQACEVVRRSIGELCFADHRGDALTLALWLANKTADNMRRWIDAHHTLVAAEGALILGVGMMRSTGEVLLNYVSPDARFRASVRASLLVSRWAPASGAWRG
jgi:hypothetical protein